MHNDRRLRAWEGKNGRCEFLDGGVGRGGGGRTRSQTHKVKMGEVLMGTKFQTNVID